MNFTESFRVIKQGDHHCAISRLYSRRRVVWREVKRWCGRSQPFPSHYTALNQGPSSKVRQGEGKNSEQWAPGHKPHRLCHPSGSKQDEEAGADSFLFSILPRAGHIKHSCIDWPWRQLLMKYLPLNSILPLYVHLLPSSRFPVHSLVTPRVGTPHICTMGSWLSASNRVLPPSWNHLLGFCSVLS